ncbi:hypothetical protein VT25_17245 [Photobacterium leiognathi subsp. mandapamensis]|nr:hypothetical protein VT25_17245 [Photobacterium leiognathi subsp. mandapamensis]
MEELKSLLIGIIGTLIVMAGVRFIKDRRKKTLKGDIEFIDLELESLSKMKRSSVEMNRASFRGVFALLFLFSIANAISYTLDWLNIPMLRDLKYILVVVTWGSSAGIAWIWWKRYDNLKNYAEAVKRLQSKKEKKEAVLTKLENS